MTEASSALRIVARGISCRDCTWFGDAEDTPTCWAEDLPVSTDWARIEGNCGPEARWFLERDEVENG